jgi:hypothetical protein
MAGGSISKTSVICGPLAIGPMANGPSVIGSRPTDTSQPISSQKASERIPKQIRKQKTYKRKKLQLEPSEAGAQWPRAKPQDIKLMKR